MNKLGIKRKLLLVLVGVLLLTTMLDALLASYFTNRQNQETSFVALNRSLRAWHDQLQTMTRRLEAAALSTVDDTVVLNQLNELILLEMPNVAGNVQLAQDVTIARGLSYAKSVSLNRLSLALRTSGFSRIAVYTGGKLSHVVSSFEAGMMRQRGPGGPVWVTTSDARGNLDFQGWPAWQPGPLPPGTPPTVADLARPTVSVTFPAPQLASINILVPVQGVFEEYLTDFSPLKYRLVSGMSIADPDHPKPPPPGSGQIRIVAVLVFSRLIDHSLLGAVAASTGMAPELFSPDGRHRQYVAEAAVIPDALVRAAQGLASTTQAPAVLQRTIESGQGSFHAVLRPWRYANRTHMILGLSASRDSTLLHIRQTVVAILLASSLILVFSIAVGTYWIGRFIDPIVALTDAAKQIGQRRQLADRVAEGGAVPLEQFEPIPVVARDEIGELSAAFNGMAFELKRAFETLEQRVQGRTAELRQQTRYLRTLIDTLPLWVWLKDTELRYLAVNQANAAACGCSIDDMVGHTDQQLWPSDLAERFLADDVAVMTTHQRSTVEQAFAGPEGEVWMEIYRVPVLDEDGTLLGMVGVAHNISERKAAEAAREAALAEAVHLARQRSDFLAQMSHELRTPLNAIMGYAQLLRRDTEHLTERQASGLATIHESSQHLLTLIDDILDLARVEAGKLVLRATPTHLATFLRVVADIIRVKAEEKSLAFAYVAAPDLPVAVTVDDKRLRQVLLNLLGNAVKFTDRGTVALRVGTTASASPAPARGPGTPPMARLRFEVADSGIGMSAEQLVRIFQPFEQVADLQRREGGTGLGLAISQQLVHLMGGEIGVKSEPGRGSLFWFELDVPVSADTLHIPAVPATIIGYHGQRKRLLIVDDVPKNRAMLMDMLQGLGFSVADARNGQECLSLLDSFQPDLIVMDVMMPVMDGRETTRRIRRLSSGARIPIIHVTASASPEDEAASYAAGANAFLAKPVEQDLLLAAIGTQLSLSWITEGLPLEAPVAGAEDQSDLVIPPVPEIEVLAHLARLGNMQKIAERADYLDTLDPAYAPFAQRVRTLAQTYQSKALAAFVARYQAGQQAPPVTSTDV
jgi:PAS domain S-box-containing protein